jgi:signal transduction histidine kinase
MAALGELAAGLTHELRNALATISGYVRLLEAAEGEARARYLAAVGREATSLGTVLERFLRFAEPRELRREPVDLVSLAGDVASRVVAALPGTKVTVAGVAAPLRVDRLAVGVAIENLVRNAVEAVAATGGSVSLSISADRSRAVVEVEDDGPGVGDDVRGRLFSPFATSKSSGGLGLALARRLARLHGGDVTYEPRASGGSRFTLVLPREDEP